jgi:hypothetical protein
VIQVKEDSFEYHILVLAANQTEIGNLTAQKNTAEGNFETIVNNIKLVLGSAITETQSLSRTKN